MRSVNGLKDSKESKYAKERFNIAKQDYIKEHFGRPLEKIHVFYFFNYYVLNHPLISCFVSISSKKLKNELNLA